MFPLSHSIFIPGPIVAIIALSVLFLIGAILICWIFTSIPKKPSHTSDIPSSESSNPPVELEPAKEECIPPEERKDSKYKHIHLGHLTKIPETGLEIRMIPSMTDTPHVSHTSNPEFISLKQDATMEALRDRTVKIPSIFPPFEPIKKETLALSFKVGDLVYHKKYGNIVCVAENKDDMFLDADNRSYNVSEYDKVQYIKSRFSTGQIVYKSAENRFYAYMIQEVCGCAVKVEDKWFHQNLFTFNGIQQGAMIVCDNYPDEIYEVIGVEKNKFKIKGIKDGCLAVARKNEIKFTSEFASTFQTGDYVYKTDRPHDTIYSISRMLGCAIQLKKGNFETWAHQKDYTLWQPVHKKGEKIVPFDPKRGDEHRKNYGVVWTVIDDSLPDDPTMMNLRSGKDAITVYNQKGSFSPAPNGNTFKKGEILVAKHSVTLHCGDKIEEGRQYVVEEADEYSVHLFGHDFNYFLFERKNGIQPGDYVKYINPDLHKVVRVNSDQITLENGETLEMSEVVKATDKEVERQGDVIDNLTLEETLSFMEKELKPTVKQVKDFDGKFHVGDRIIVGKRVYTIATVTVNSAALEDCVRVEEDNEVFKMTDIIHAPKSKKVFRVGDKVQVCNNGVSDKIGIVDKVDEYAVAVKPTIDSFSVWYDPTQVKLKVRARCKVGEPLVCRRSGDIEIPVQVCGGTFYIQNGVQKNISDYTRATRYTSKFQVGDFVQAKINCNMPNLKGKIVKMKGCAIQIDKWDGWFYDIRFEKIHPLAVGPVVFKKFNPYVPEDLEVFGVEKMEGDIVHARSRNKRGNYTVRQLKAAELENIEPKNPFKDGDLVRFKEEVKFSRVPMEVVFKSYYGIRVKHLDPRMESDEILYRWDVFEKVEIKVGDMVVDRKRVIGKLYPVYEVKYYSEGADRVECFDGKGKCVLDLADIMPAPKNCYPPGTILFYDNSNGKANCVAQVASSLDYGLNLFDNGIVYCYDTLKTTKS